MINGGAVQLQVSFLSVSAAALPIKAPLLQKVQKNEIKIAALKCRFTAKCEVFTFRCSYRCNFMEVSMALTSHLKQYTFSKESKTFTIAK